MVVTNGFLAISVIWVTAVLLFQAKAASEQLIQSHNSLEYQVMKRTKELSERVTIKEHTEEALKESMERLKITLETASDRFWEMDENFRLCNLTNYTGAKPLPGKEKFLGKTRWEAAGGDPEKDEKWRQHRDDHLAHRPYRDFEFSVTDKNGEDHYLSASGIPVFNDDGTFKGYRGSARNITASKMTELALMVSQNRFESILELAADAIISLDENHRITFFNAAAESMFGYQRHEVLGQTLDRFLPEDMVERHRDHVERFAQSQTDTMYMSDRPEVTARRSNGEIFSVEASLSRRKTPEGLMLTVMMRDITERKNAEESLRKSEEWFRAIVNTSPAGITLKDFDSRYLMVNDTFASWMKMDVSDILGKTPPELYPDEHALAGLKNDKEVFRTGKVHVTEDTRKFRDGVLRSVITHKCPIRSHSGEIIATSTIITDITDFKQAELALQESEAKFRDIAEAASDLFWELDEDLRFRFVSSPEAWTGAKGYSGGDLIGKTRWKALGIDPEKDEHWRKHVEGLKAHKPFRDFHSFYTDKNGCERHWQLSGVPVFDADGVFKGYRGSSSEITARVQAEEERECALRQAEEANQAKSEFLATMSHELRTPLNAILGFSEVLSNQYFGPLGSEKYQEYADNIFDSGGYLLGLVNNLLDISRIEAGEYQLSKELVDVRELVNGCYQITAQRANEAGLTLQKRCSVQLPPLYADNMALKQILLNLLTNAVKFTPNGGKITVSASNKGDIYTIKVTDTGVGIPKEDLWKLTHPFDKGKYDPYVTNDGAGLGLAITQSLVDLHNGELDIKSKAGKGTTVTVTLPNKAP